MQLDRFPRTPLACLPTPLEPADRLADQLGGPRLWIKRDDQTGLGLGGNKVRKLEFLLADALARRADTVVTTGGLQSNHARQTAAAAARLGLDCKLLLPRAVPIATPQYEQSGNVLLDRLFGAEVVPLAADEFSDALVDNCLGRLRSQGRSPYFIPTGGSTPLGALGYVAAALELVRQLEERSLAIDAIVVPTGSAGTHAGILAGLALAGLEIPVFGIAVSATSREKSALVGQLLAETLRLLGGPTSDPPQVNVDGRQVGPGYGLPTAAVLEAVRLTARLQGLLLDPVYTGKAMAGLIEGIRAGRFGRGSNVLFWHTGGIPALFAYQDVLENTGSLS